MARDSDNPMVDVPQLVVDRLRALVVEQERNPAPTGGQVGGMAPVATRLGVSGYTMRALVSGDPHRIRSKTLDHIVCRLGLVGWVDVYTGESLLESRAVA